MKLVDLLTNKRSTLVNRWLERAMEAYPADTKRFLRKQKDQFANPVGYTTSKAIDNLYDTFLQTADPERFSPILDKMIRIRAIQDFSPSQALSFIFLLKNVIREELESEIRENRLADELLVFESKIDTVALLAFDIYMQCREKLYEIRVKETKTQVSRLLQRANLQSEIPEWESKPKESDSNNLQLIDNETR